MARPHSPLPLVTLCITLLVPLGCSRLEEPAFVRSDLRTQGLHGPVRHIVTEVATLGGGAEEVRVRESELRFGGGGELLETRHYNQGGTPQHRLSYHYEGGRVEETSSDADGHTLYRWVHRYDPQGREVSLSGYGPSGARDYHLVKHHDASGRVVLEQSLRADGQTAAETHIRYDTSGYTRETHHASAAGTPAYRSVERYDPAGNRVEERIEDADGTFETVVYYSYNADGKLLSETVQDASGATSYRLVNRYEGGYLAETNEYGADGEVRYLYVYSYDPYGNPTEKSSFDGYGTLLSSTTHRYRYDVHGNWVEQLSSRWHGGRSAPKQVRTRTITYG